MLYPELKTLIQLKAVAAFKNLGVPKKIVRTSQGERTSIFHGLGVEFETVRPYVVGDDVRYIDWRVTARSGKAHVKTFRVESDLNITLIIDANAYMRFGTRGTFKSLQAANVAALLGWKSLQQQDRIGALIFGDVANGFIYHPPCKTETGLLSVLMTLCNKQMNLHSQVSISNALTHLAALNMSRNLTIIIADFGNEDCATLEKKLLAQRKKSKIALIAIYDPSDQSIPSCGVLSFTNSGTTITLDTNDKLARLKYYELWQRYVSNLQRIANKIQAPLLWVGTNQDPAELIFARTEVFNG